MRCESGRTKLVQKEHVPTRFRHRGALQSRPPGGRPARHLATATDRVTAGTSHRHGLVCNVNLKPAPTVHEGLANCQLHGSFLVSILYQLVANHEELLWSLSGI